MIQEEGGCCFICPLYASLFGLNHKLFLIDKELPSKGSGAPRQVVSKTVVGTLFVFYV